MDDNDITCLDSDRTNKKNIDAVLLSYAETFRGGQNLNITIYSQFAKELGWLAGDRVRIGETEKHFCLVRTNNGFGIKLLPTGAHSLILSSYDGIDCIIECRYVPRSQINIDGSDYIWIEKKFTN